MAAHELADQAIEGHQGEGSRTGKRVILGRTAMGCREVVRPANLPRIVHPAGAAPTGTLPQFQVWPMLRHMPNDSSENTVVERHASLFRNGRNQAVRIPREFEMEGTEVLMRKDGDRLILTPIRKNRLQDLLASWEPLDEALPDVEDKPPQRRDEL